MLVLNTAATQTCLHVQTVDSGTGAQVPLQTCLACRQGRSTQCRPLPVSGSQLRPAEAGRTALTMAPACSSHGDSQQGVVN